ncbi:MAG: hypothetical protein ACLRSW_13710 [Christensenellaceae bacterium]
MKFSGYYWDGAIVQRNAPVPVRGYAAASAAVKCVLSGGNIRAEKRTETDGKGRFEVVFDAVSDVESAFVLSAEAGGEKIWRGWFGTSPRWVERVRPALFDGGLREWCAGGGSGNLSSTCPNFLFFYRRGDPSRPLEDLPRIPGRRERRKKSRGFPR